MLDLKEIRARGGRVPIGAKDRKGNEIHLGDTIRFMDAKEWGSEDVPQGVVRLESGKLRQPGGSAGDLDQYFEIIRKGDPDPDVAALLSELDRLTTALAAAQAERDNLHTIAESRLMRMRTASQLLIAEIGAKGPENVDITAGRAVAVIEALKAELATARRGPVVEWRTRIDVEEATPGDFGLVVGEGGWTLEFFDKHGDAMQVDSGPETGDAGKAACFAAYLKAVGLA